MEPMWKTIYRLWTMNTHAWLNGQITNDEREAADEEVNRLAEEAGLK